MNAWSHRGLAAVALLCLIVVMGIAAKQNANADEAERDGVVVRGTMGKPRQFSIEELKKLPRTEVDAIDRKGQNVKYAGVNVAALLKEVGTASGEKLRGEWMRAFVTVDARDDYRAVFALAEFDADFTDRVIILAYEKDGQPIDQQVGPLQIIVPGEKKHARWVRMVKQIRVLDSNWIKD